MPSIDTIAALSEDDYVSIFAAPPVPAELDEYLRTHRVRLLDTAARVPVPERGHVVDIGTSPPHELCTLLWLMEPTARFSAVVHPDSAIPAGPVDPVRPRRSESPVRPPITRVRADAEVERLPFETASVDVAVCTEVLEHLLLNPLNLVREAARIVRPGGTFVLTTPNVASIEGVARMLAGHHPFGFNTYSPYGGYGRHNREYTPSEVAVLCEAAGFSTMSLSTIDTYPPVVDTSAVRGLVPDDGLRGQNTIYVGRRDRYDPISTPPGLLGHDPLRHRVALGIAPGTAVGDDGRLRGQILVTNDGDLPWEVLHGVQVVASVVDFEGRVAQPKVAAFAVSPVPDPGHTARVPIDIEVPGASSGLALELDVAGIGMLGFSRLCSLSSRLRLRAGQGGVVASTVGGVEPGWPLVADFRAGRPVLAWTEGLANPEPWGTWTVGPVARIHLPVDLPPWCELTFEAQAFGPNADRPIRVTVASTSGEASFGSAPSTSTVVLNDIPPGTCTIELAIPEPTTPRSLDIGPDDRPLGLGLILVYVSPVA